MRRAQNTRKSQAGNVLFIILIGVGLFAALSFAVTQSGRGSKEVLSREQAVLNAAEVSNYIQEIRNAITRLRYNNGCSDTQINFENTVFIGTTVYNSGAAMLPLGDNPNSPATKKCNIFDPAGGGVVPRILGGSIGPMPAATGTRSGHPWFKVAPINGVKSSAADIVIVYGHTTEAVCRAFATANDNVAISTAGDDGLCSGTGFFSGGTYASTCPGLTTIIPTGVREMCWNKSAASNEWHILSVILAR